MTIEYRMDQYYDHLIASWKYWCHGFTLARLKRVRQRVVTDTDVLTDILFRHSGRDRDPEQMQVESPETYDHCMGNLAGMTLQTMKTEKVLKP